MTAYVPAFHRRSGYNFASPQSSHITRHFGGICDLTPRQHRQLFDGLARLLPTPVPRALAELLVEVAHKRLNVSEALDRLGRVENQSS